MNIASSKAKRQYAQRKLFETMNLNEEVRNGYLITAETKKVWAVQIDLLKHLVDACQRHNLKIWADGGTLLGTVREHGYIPWDDDIDMFMLREDYERLRE